MLFIEEIQSDWHNEGHKEGYLSKEQSGLNSRALSDKVRKLEVGMDERFESDEFKDIVNSYMNYFSIEYADSAIGHLLSISEYDLRRVKNQIFSETVLDSAAFKEYEDYVSKRDKMIDEADRVYEITKNKAPDAPFRDNYHEFVLKNLLRMATERGYDSIGWTPADIQIKRWSDQFAKGYKIEYDQDIPKFLNKYGKQWDAKVGISTLDANGKKVWSMDITDAMRHSVLYEGQPLYSLRDDGVPDLFESWEEAVETYGAIPKGENPARDIKVPQQIGEKKVVSQFARTMLEAEVTPDENISDFEKAIMDGEMTHEIITNKKAQGWAKKQIEHLGFEDALNKWSVLSDSNKIGKKELVLGMELYNQCITNGDVHNAMKIAAELAAEATRAGQTLQACRVLKLMTPDGQLYYLEKSIQKMNEEFRERLGDKFKDIKLDEDLMEEFFTEKDEAKRNETYDKICQDIADQIPATKLDKWNAWRYLAMLGNPKTHIRNIVGNGIFYPVMGLKNYVGAFIEKAAHIKTEDRTMSFHKSKEAVAFAKEDFKAMVKTLQGENAKYAITSDIEGKRTIFNTKWLEKLRTKNFDWLEKEDMWFLERHYVNALARLITARKLDVNTIDAQTLNKLRTFAVKEAQAATYRDANIIAEGLNKLQKKWERYDNKAVRASSAFIEGVMPFKKTPMNIAKQGVYYSPIGLLKSVYTAAVKVKNGDATATDVIDDLAKGLTGTGVMLLGYLLASLGLLEGDDDEPTKKKAFDKMVGEQAYSFKVKDVFSYTLDWAVPSNLSLFIGAKLHSATKDEFKVADIVSAVSTISEPLLELSVLSGLNGVIETAQYSDSSPIVATVSDMVTSYLMQALPTMGGQINRILDDTKREYYFVDKNSDVPKGLQRLIGQAASKVPGASLLFEPSIDEWGREEKYGGVLERVLENTVSPGYYAEDNYTETDKKLKELYDSTGEASVLPTTQQKYFKEDGTYYYLSAKDYTEAKRLRGQKSFELINTLLSDKVAVKLQNKETKKYSKKKYSQMTDAEKVTAIEKCYKDAGEYTKEQMLEKVKASQTTK